MSRTVIVPLDGSRFAEQALPLATAIARAAGSSLHLVHVHQSLVFEGLPYSEHDQGWDIEARRQELDYLGETAERARAAATIGVHVELLEGDPAKSVLEYARKVDAELVVMATHGRGGIARAWLGSVADELVRKAELPLLLVRPAGEDPVDLAGLPDVRRVLIPLDGSRLAEHVIAPAMRVGDVFGASYTLLRVIIPTFVPGAPQIARAIDEDRLLGVARERETREYLAHVQERLSESGATVDTRIAVGSPAQTILDQADEIGADLIAIATHGRGATLRAFLGSVADKVVRGSTRPVLVYRPRT